MQNVEIAAAAVFDPSFPLAHRSDLPEYERQLSANVLALLDAGIKSAIDAPPIDLGSFAEFANDDDDVE